MSSSLTLVVVDAQIDYCDEVKRTLTVHDNALNLTRSFNEILAMTASVVRAATKNLPPQARTTTPHNPNSVQKSLMKLSNIKQVRAQHSRVETLAYILSTSNGELADYS